MNFCNVQSVTDIGCIPLNAVNFRCFINSSIAAYKKQIRIGCKEEIVNIGMCVFVKTIKSFLCGISKKIIYHYAVIEKNHFFILGVYLNNKTAIYTVVGSGSNHFKSVSCVR